MTCFDSIVPAIVRTWCDFIEEHFAGFGEEHFHAKDSHALDSFHTGKGDLLCFCVNIMRASCRRNHHTAYMIFLDCFHARVYDMFASSVASHHNGKLRCEADELFRHDLAGFFGLGERIISGDGFLFGANGDIAIAVIAQGSCFDDKGKSVLFPEIRCLLRRVQFLECSHRYACGGERFLLSEFILH